MLELKDKQVIDDQVHLIAEYNIYKDGKLVQQLSRSAFTYPASMTDEEISADIMTNYYYIYE